MSRAAPGLAMKIPHDRAPAGDEMGPAVRLGISANPGKDVQPRAAGWLQRGRESGTCSERVAKAAARSGAPARKDVDNFAESPRIGVSLPQDDTTATQYPTPISESPILPTISRIAGSESKHRQKTF